MSEDGRAFGLEAQGFRNLNAVRGNLSAPALYEEAVRRGLEAAARCVAKVGSLP